MMPELPTFECDWKIMVIAAQLAIIEGLLCTKHTALIYLVPLNPKASLS
jgi:hypothetical protein